MLFSQNGKLKLRCGFTITAAVTDPSTPGPIASPSVRNRLRNPQIFSGTLAHDVDDWLVHYESDNRHNFRDETMKLANVAFFLHSMGLRWSGNHKEEITFRVAFKITLGDAFDNA